MSGICNFLQIFALKHTIKDIVITLYSEVSCKNYFLCVVTNLI